MAKNFLPEELNLVKALFPNAEVSFTTCGNIKIVNPLNCDCDCYWGHPCKKWYVIGFNYDGFWIRRVKWDLHWKETNSTFPLHYNRKTGNYCFETFKEALEYFVNSVKKNKIDF